MPQTIFISHSTKDDDHINRIADTLENAGHTVWVDHRNGIQPGVPSWEKTIREAISNCDIGVFVMSENSLDSPICGSECLLIQELKKPLYVLRLQKCEPAHIWLYIKQIQYADLVTDFNTGMTAFLDTLGGNMTAESPKPFMNTVTGRDTLRIYLPFLKNPLRGREADVNAVQSLIKPHQITQIVGVGGWGKSRISAEIALAYPQGAVWHRCSEVGRSYELISLFREHFGFPQETKADDVLAHMSQMKPLVVVDNAEEVKNADARADYVALLLQLMGLGVPVLITTRRLWDEFKPRVQYPPPQLPLPIATQITADFAESQNIPMTADEARQLAEAGRLHPRLIELAVLIVPEIGFDATLRRLKSLKHDDIQDALEEMIHKTLAQMRDEAKHGADAYALIHNMTWLYGTFTLEAVMALAPDHLKDEDELADTLTTLGRYQFVPFDMTTKRYSLLDVVCDALGKPKDPALFDAYADFYLGRAKAIFVDLEDHPELWNEHEADFINIKTLGNELMTRTQNGTTGDVARAMRFAEYTSIYVPNRMEERAWAWLEMGVNAVREVRKGANDAGLMRIEAKLLRRWGSVWYLLGEKQKALELYNQGLALSQVDADKKGEASALNNIGNVWYALGDNEKALEFYEQSLPLARTVGDKRGEAYTLLGIGNVWSNLGDKYKALEFYEQSLTLARAVNNKGGEARTLNSMGSVWSDLGNKHKALEFYEQSLPLAHTVGDKGGEAIILMNIGNRWSDLGDKHKALDFYEQSLTLKRAVGDKGGEAITLINMGAVWSDLGDNHKALEFYEQSLPLARAVGDKGGEANTLNNIGAVWADLGDNHKALEFYQQAVPLYETIGVKDNYANTLRNIGYIHYQLGDLEQAITYFERAIATTYDGDPRISEWEGNVEWLKSKRDGEG